MTGQELRQLLLDKWGRSYDIQLRRIKGQIFVQVMWKYLEQASFPLSESEYVAHLNAIADYLQAWGGVSQVKNYLEKNLPRVLGGRGLKQCCGDALSI